MRPRNVLGPLAAALLLSACGSNATSADPPRSSATGPATSEGSDAESTPVTPSAPPSIPGTIMTGKVLTLVVPPDWEPEKTGYSHQLMATARSNAMTLDLNEGSCECSDTATPAWVDFDAKDYMDFDKQRHPKRLPNLTMGGQLFWHLREYDKASDMRADLYHTVYGGRYVELEIDTYVTLVDPKESQRTVDQILASVQFKPPA